MGVLNVTPDSFSDGGRYFDPEQAVDHALALVAQGADLLDIGGESTRPRATPVPLEEELRRVVPVVEALAGRVAVPLSVDTYKAEVARQSLEAGASIINDVTALEGDPAMPGVAADSRAGVICMHMQGTPQTMQDNPVYDDVVGEVADFLETRVEELVRGGIEIERIAIDPGICFGKRTAHDLELLRRIDRFVETGRPVCVGVSRKGIIDKLLRPRPVEDRLFGTIGVVLSVCRRGVQIVRVHDVGAVREALELFLAVEPEEPD